MTKGSTKRKSRSPRRRLPGERTSASHTRKKATHTPARAQYITWATGRTDGCADSLFRRWVGGRAFTASGRLGVGGSVVDGPSPQVQRVAIRAGLVLNLHPGRVGAHLLLCRTRRQLQITPAPERPQACVFRERKRLGEPQHALAVRARMTTRTCSPTQRAPWQLTTMRGKRPYITDWIDSFRGIQPGVGLVSSNFRSNGARCSLPRAPPAPPRPVQKPNAPRPRQKKTRNCTTNFRSTITPLPRRHRCGHHATPRAWADRGGTATASSWRSSMVRRH